MEEGPARTRPCDNCKRDIPEDNFTIHSVYCCRNLRICQLCKEPVAIADMEKHTAQVSCSQCGETMQACDIPAHKTDACSFTQVQCIYCELSLERAAMADHELYCGSRTEKCSECSELILIKYKKLHEESNHSFIKLDDEPGPQPSWKVNSKETKSSTKSKAFLDHKPKQRNEHSHSKREHKIQAVTGIVSEPSTTPFETNPTHTNESDKPVHRSPVSRGAIKKRIAPQPPVNSSSSSSLKSHDNVAVLKPFKHNRDVPLYKALTREQQYRKSLDEENAYRAANNLPLLLNPAEKVEKLRKMSALQNMDFGEINQYNGSHKEKQSSKSHAKKSHEVRDAFGNPVHIPKTKKDVNLKTDKNNKTQFLDYCEENDALVPTKDDFSINSNLNKNIKKEKKITNKPLKLENANPSLTHASTSLQPTVYTEFSPSSFNILKKDKNEINFKASNSKKNRIGFSENSENLDSYVSSNINPVDESKPFDRFCDIKNDLRALRKELKKCSSPLENRRYMSRNTENITPIQDIESNRTVPMNLNIPNLNVEPNVPLDLYKITNETQYNEPSNTYDDDDHSLSNVMLPCEFCEQMIRANLLVAHETGCRPNITSFANDRAVSNNLSENTAPPNTPDGHHAPKLANINIYNGKPDKENIKNIVTKKRELSNESNTQSTVIVPPEEEIDEASGDLDEVKLPCEFCMTLVPACRLVWHQEACYAA